MKSQPTCAWKRPLSAPRTPPPWPTCGLWGSPSLSEKAWCLRWSATQAVTGPSIAIEPMIASPPWTQGLALNARCVRWRWKPTVTPRPVIRYMIRKTATSLQWRRSFQTCQPTIPSAMNGRTVMVPVAIRSRVSFATGWTSSMPGVGGRRDWGGLGLAHRGSILSSRRPSLPRSIATASAPTRRLTNAAGGRLPLAAAHLACVGHRGGRALAQRVAVAREHHAGRRAPRCGPGTRGRARCPRSGGGHELRPARAGERIPGAERVAHEQRADALEERARSGRGCGPGCAPPAAIRARRARRRRA